jgi:hypothetical protein
MANPWSHNQAVAYAEEKLRVVKANCCVCVGGFRVDPQNRALKIAADDAEYAASQAGRELALLRFEAEIERGIPVWMPVMSW